MEDPSDRRVMYKVIGPGKPKRVSKGPWESKIRKGPRKPRKANGPRMPKRKMGHKNPQTVQEKA